MAANQKIGFDVGQFISPFVPSIGAQQLAVQASNATADNWQNLMRSVLAERAQKEALAERARQFDESLAQDDTHFGVAQGGMNARAAAQIAQEQRRLEAQLAQKQREARAGTVGEAVNAFSAGDRNALEGAIRKGSILDPMFSAILPGDVLPQRPAAAPELASEAQVFGDVPQKSKDLVLAAGGQELYRGNADSVRQREMDVTGNALKELAGSPFAPDYEPAISAGLNVAGRGLTGKAAAEMALKQANIESDRLMKKRGQDAMAVNKLDAQNLRETGADNRLALDVHDRVQRMATEVSSKRDLSGLRKAQESLAQTTQLMDGTPLEQMTGVLKSMSAVMKGALSDRDVATYMGGAGKWEALISKMNSWSPDPNDPKLSQAFIDQVKNSSQRMVEAINRSVMNAGIAARDLVYSAGLPYNAARPDVDPYEATALYGLQAYTQVTGDTPTPEEVMAEADRLRAQFPGRFARPAVPAQMAPPGVDPMGGPVPSLGVAPLPGGSRSRSSRKSTSVKLEGDAANKALLDALNE